MMMIGFMQGRLSPLVDGRIQAFPWGHWREEFALAQEHGFKLMEWTLDQERLHENPLLAPGGHDEIKSLCQRYEVKIQSLTGDCFMQAPFWKESGKSNSQLKRDFLAVVEACSRMGISIIVVPLVDNGSLENARQEDDLVDFLRSQSLFFMGHRVRIAFESEYEPKELARFIDRLDPEIFGINYDIGNSAALGFSPEEEFNYYGARIMNVHVKDRPLKSSTVPLGDGQADFKTVFRGLKKLGYKGNYILQTARANGLDHAGVLCRYRDITVDWLKTYGA